MIFLIYVDILKYTEENNLTKNFIENLEKNDLKNFIKYTPFPSKKRILTFTTENVADDDAEKQNQEKISTLI